MRLFKLNPPPVNYKQIQSQFYTLSDRLSYYDAHHTCYTNLQNDWI